MEKIEFSKHAKEDRNERIVFIATKVGFGEVVGEALITDEKHGAHYECITNTGVMIIKTADKKMVITMYIARLNQVLGIYKERNRIPISLKNTIKRNEKRKLMEESEKVGV